MDVATADAVARRALDGFEGTVDRLAGYLAHPAISCEPEHAKDVQALAERVAADLGKIGLERSRVLGVEGALPLVAAEWLRAGADKPTVLIYGHLDLQPVPEDNWETPPHEAVRKGERLYARGSADDMGGWVSHLASLSAWFDEVGGPPCNVKLVIEGEEEIGSPNLERYMDAFPDAFESDVMILTDCENPSTEVPGLTVSLRGLRELELVCEALDADGHSGLYGNMVPDVGVALVSLIARLVDGDGRLKIGRTEVDEAWRRGAAVVDAETIRKGAHLLPGVAPLPERGRPAAEWLWRQPAMTVVATTLPTYAQKKNALRRKATAVLSIRVGAGQDGAELLEAIAAELMRDPPGGVRVSVRETGTAGEGWLYEPKGPAFDAANRAYRRSWGHDLVRVGVGGSIPFVALFGRRFGDMPLILNGVIDPETTCHGPNESLHLGVFRKAIAANVYLLDEIAALGRDGVR